MLKNDIIARAYNAAVFLKARTGELSAAPDITASMLAVYMEQIIASGAAIRELLALGTPPTYPEIQVIADDALAVTIPNIVTVFGTADALGTSIIDHYDTTLFATAKASRTFDRVAGTHSDPALPEAELTTLRPLLTSLSGALATVV